MLKTFYVCIALPDKRRRGKEQSGQWRAVGTKATAKASALTPLPAESHRHRGFLNDGPSLPLAFLSTSDLVPTDLESKSTILVLPQQGYNLDQSSRPLPNDDRTASPAFYVGEALYSPLLFLHTWIEMQSEGEGKRGGTYAQGKKGEGGEKNPHSFSSGSVAQV